MRLLVGMIRRADHRADRGVRETQAIGFPLEQGKPVGMHVAQHWQMRGARLQILADGKHVDPVRAHVAHHVEDLVIGLPQTPSSTVSASDPRRITLVIVPTSLDGPSALCRTACIMVGL